mgnify:CR=1 FL=1
MEANEEELKIILVGESGVGKTSIINRFIHDTFEDNSPTTTSGTFSAKILLFNDGKKLIFNLWDTAGQEKFRSLTKIFYKQAKVAILVYDITKQDSLDKIKNFWINDLKENITSDIILFLVGNKIDLLEKEEASEEDAQQFAKKMNIDLFNISAKENSGIDKLFNQIAKKYTGRDDFKFINSLEELKKQMDKINSGKLKENNNNKKKKCC